MIYFRNAHCNRVLVAIYEHVLISNEELELLHWPCDTSVYIHNIINDRQRGTGHLYLSLFSLLSIT